jgi:hypothetical protein
MATALAQRAASTRERSIRVLLGRLDFVALMNLVDTSVNSVHCGVKVFDEALHHVAFEIDVLEQAKAEECCEHLKEICGLLHA